MKLDEVTFRDPAFLCRHIRESLRAEDLDGVLAACEALYLTTPQHAGESRATEAIRSALVWALSDVSARVAPFHEVFQEALGGQRREAARIANLARLLPDPQPMERCGACKGEGSIGRRAHTRAPLMFTRCKVCSGRKHCARTPGPTHALRLYVDALRLAKGEGWFDWWPKRLGHDNRANPWYIYSTTRWAENELWLSPEPRNPTAKVHSDGRIECGPICPPLPEVV